MICDTSGLLSAHVSGETLHEESLDALNMGETLVLSPFVLCEIDYLAATRYGRQVATRILDELSHPEYELAALSRQDLSACLDVVSTYQDLGVGLTDASLVVLAKRYGTDEILTLDQRHFRAIRGLDGRHFRLLPFDV